MNVLGVGTGELLLILVIVLLVMGPERLPELIRQWAKLVKTLRQYTRSWQQFNAELNRQLTLEELAENRPRPAPKPAAAPPAADVEPEDNAIAPPSLAALDAAHRSSQAGTDAFKPATTLPGTAEHEQLTEPGEQVSGASAAAEEARHEQ